MHRSIRLRWVLAGALSVTAALLQQAAGGECTPSAGPDVIVGDLVGWSKWGTVGGISAYSMGTTSCNIGDEVLPWDAESNNHPVIAQHAFRLKGGRFEQIGLSWLKHGWGALTENVCCTCINPQNFEALGVGCSDPYDSGLNGDQNGIASGGSCIAGLGPRSQVNAATGFFPYPAAMQCTTGNAIYKRLQIHMSDLDPVLNPASFYFAESHYVTPHDAAAGNGNNNASFRRFTVGSLTGGSYNLSFNGAFPIQRQKPAIQAWQDHDPAVALQTVDVPGDGRFILASKCSDNGNGTWHFEYALYNMNSHRSGRSWSVPIPSGVSVTNVGFHDVDYHGGDGEVMGTTFDGTDWSSVLAAGAIEWSTASFATNPNANALRWGTLYNFRFDADAPPRAVMASMDLFRLGGKSEPAFVAFSTCGPAKAGDLNGDGVVNVSDLLGVIGAWGPCPPPPASCPADFAPGGGDGVVNVTDLLFVISNWG